MVAPSRVGLALEQLAGAIGKVGRIAAIARILGHAGNRGVIGYADENKVMWEELGSVARSPRATWWRSVRNCFRGAPPRRALPGQRDVRAQKNWASLNSRSTPASGHNAAPQRISALGH